MSQFSTMTTRERKIQAAAICREIQGPEDVEMDLGRKVNAPKDIMYEELSLASNRGSRLFKMRQKRSEKYTFESIQNRANAQATNGTEVHTENGDGTSNQNGDSSLGGDQPTETPAGAADITIVPNPDSIAPGYAGPLKDVPPEKFNSTAIPRTYHSPWNQAIINDPALADTLISSMPEPRAPQELPGYKSFNRVATPFGGFGNAPRITPIKAPQLDAVPFPDYSDLQADTAVKRASFNRTALGWVSTGAPVLLPEGALDPMSIPESDEL